MLNKENPTPSDPEPQEASVTSSDIDAYRKVVDALTNKKHGLTSDNTLLDADAELVPFEQQIRQQEAHDAAENARLQALVTEDEKQIAALQRQLQRRVSRRELFTSGIHKTKEFTHDHGLKVAVGAVGFGVIFGGYEGVKDLLDTTPQTPEQRQAAAVKKTQEAEQKTQQEGEYETQHALSDTFSTKSLTGWEIRHPVINEAISYEPLSGKDATFVRSTNTQLDFTNKAGGIFNHTVDKKQTDIFFSQYNPFVGDRIPALRVAYAEDGRDYHYEDWLIGISEDPQIDTSIVEFFNTDSDVSIFTHFAIPKGSTDSLEITLVKPVSQQATPDALQ